MRYQHKFLFFISASMLYAFPSLAQSIGDIDIFGDFDEPAQTTTQQNAPSPTSLVLPPSSNVPEENEPQIGRGKDPKDSIIVPTPAPFPDVSIDLSVPPPPAKTAPSLVNNRQTAIPLSEKETPTASQPAVLSDFHDVHKFELSGFSLGMNASEIIQLAKQKGYQITKIQKGIPLFQTTYYDTLCRQSGLRAPNAIRSCIQQYAQDSDQSYIKELRLENKSARESFQFLLTSPATNNEVYQIVYQNKGDSSLNFTRPNLAKKLDRQKAFLNAVVNSFGNPDDSKKMLWGSEDSAYMQVSMSGSSYDAVITIVDNILSGQDYFANEEWQNEHPSTHHFSFAE